MPEVKLPEVSGKYGAPMGRMGRSGNTESKVRLFRVYLNSGGYDNGGAYWGVGNPLYCATDDNNFTQYRRAVNREDAKAKLLKEFPDLTFYR